MFRSFVAVSALVGIVSGQATASETAVAFDQITYTVRSGEARPAPGQFAADLVRATIAAARAG